MKNKHNIARQWQRADHSRLSYTMTSIIALLAAMGTAKAQDTTPVSTGTDTIVVTASGFEQNLADAPASISVITREELEKGGFRDLTDALKTVQGVVITGEPGEFDIQIRGLPGEYTLILVDGRRQNTRESRTNGTSGYDQSYVPPVAAIERIEVIRGPMSSLYGSDAMGGVINIITKKVASKWGGTVTGETRLQQYSDYGNSGQGTFYVNGSVLSDKVGLQIWGRGYKRAEDTYESGFAAREEGDIRARLTVTPNENHDITAEAGYTAIYRNYQEGKSYGRSGATEDRYDRFSWALAHTGRWGITTSDFSLTQEYASKARFEDADLTGNFIKETRSPKIINTVLDGKFTTPFELMGSHMLVTGGQFFNAHLTDHNPGSRTEENDKWNVNQWALFVEDEWWLTDSLSLTGGLRMDYHDSYQAHFSPRLYGVWHALDNLTIKGGVSTGFKAPEIRQTAEGYLGTTGGRNCVYGPNGTCAVIPGNPNLQPEKSINYEIGAIWDVTNSFKVGATLFHTDFTNKIENGKLYNDDGSCVRYPGDPNYCQYEHFNIDSATMKGVEVTADWQALDTLTFRANYTYTDSKRNSGDYAGFPLARTPKHAASLRADWVSPIENLDFWATATYHGAELEAGLRVTDENGKEKVIGDVVGREFDPYTIVDFGASYQFHENMKLNAAVYNLFDERVQYSTHNTSLEGRNLWAKFTVNF